MSLTYETNSITKKKCKFLTLNNRFLVCAVQVLFPPEYFLNDLAGLRADQEVLTQVVREECPLLCDHLNRFLKHFEISVVTTSWFLGLFFDSMDFEVRVKFFYCISLSI